ncbi:MAG: ABC transporter permease, partial [Bacteroidia bacterium]
MIKFILKRIVYGFLVLFGVITTVFLLFNVIPGDPARMRLGQRTDAKSVEIIRRDLGIDKPLPTQYVMFLNDMSFLSVYHTQDSTATNFLDKAKYGSPVQLFSLGGDRKLILKKPYLRRSYQNQKPVSEIIAETFPETIILALASILFASFVGIFLGVISALKKNSFFDRLVSVISTLGMAGPSFFFAIIIAWLFGYLLKDYTGLKNIGSLYTLNLRTMQEELDLKNLILPAFTLGIRPLALIIQLTRSSMLEVMSFDYIRTAKAKGLSMYKVV